MLYCTCQCALLKKYAYIKKIYYEFMCILNYKDGLFDFNAWGKRMNKSVIGSIAA
jgi:hypothetical protein